MTKKTNSASKVSIEDFRDHVAQGLGPASGALINLIDVLATGPRPASPVEWTLSPLWGYWWSSLYTAVDRASQELAETISIGLPEEIDRADGEIGGSGGKLVKGRRGVKIWMNEDNSRCS